MSRPLPVGAEVTVRVPASSANLGPGFDSLGLALDWTDDITLTVLDSGCEIEVSGEGAESVPRDRNHLVVATVEPALAELGCSLPGVRLRSHNTIPHARGLGSSSAALVAGLLIAWTLAHPDRDPDPDWLLQRANALEGHADNVAPVILGGAVLTWSVDGHAAARSARLDPRLAAVALVPPTSVLTTRARAALPATVPHRDAAANAGATALLVHALAGDLDLLGPATRDWLHQEQRAALMPESDRLRRALRADGFAAVVSGAGPTLLVLLDRAEQDELRRWLDDPAHAGLVGDFAATVLAPGPAARVLSRSGLASG